MTPLDDELDSLVRACRRRESGLYFGMAAVCFVAAAILLCMGIFIPAKTQGDQVAKVAFMLFSLMGPPLGVLIALWHVWGSRVLYRFLAQPNAVSRVELTLIKYKGGVRSYRLRLFPLSGRPHQLGVATHAQLTGILKGLRERFPAAAVPKTP